MTKEPTMKQICFEWVVCPFGWQARVCFEVVMQGEASQGVLGSVLSFLQTALNSGCVSAGTCG